MTTASAVLGRLYDAGAALAALCVVLTTILVLAQIGGRAFGILVPAVPEIAGFMLGATVFLALPATMRRGEHIRIDLLLPRLPLLAKRFLELSYRAAGAVVLSYLGYEMVIMTYDSWDFGDRSAGLIGIPIWIPQAAMTTGAFLLALRCAEEAVLLLAGRHLAADPTPTDG